MAGDCLRIRCQRVEVVNTRGVENLGVFRGRRLFLFRPSRSQIADNYSTRMGGCRTAARTPNRQSNRFCRNVISAQNSTIYTIMASPRGYVTLVTSRCELTEPSTII